MKDIILIINLFMTLSLNSRQNEMTSNVKSSQHEYTLSEKNYVIFHSLSQQEYDSIIKSGNLDFNEVLSDFNYYSKEIEPYLKEKGFEVYFTNKDEFLIDTMHFRFDDSSHVGALIYYNEKKMELRGVYSDIDFKMYIDNLIKKEE